MLLAVDATSASLTRSESASVFGPMQVAHWPDARKGCFLYQAKDIRLQAPSAQDFVVFRTLLGVYSTSDTPLDFGPFTVFHPARHRNEFSKEFATEHKSEERIGKEEYVISVNKAGREYARAKERADESFRAFGNVLQYMSAVIKSGYTWFSPGIFEQNRARFQEHLAVNGVDLSKSQMVLGPWLEMDSVREEFVDGSDVVGRANQLLRGSYRQPFVVPEQV